MCNLHCITLFALVLNFLALVLHILHSFLSQSESSNFFMYIISLVTTFAKWLFSHFSKSSHFSNSMYFIDPLLAQPSSNVILESFSVFFCISFFSGLGRALAAYEAAEKEL